MAPSDALYNKSNAGIEGKLVEKLCWCRHDFEYKSRCLHASLSVSY